jgi:3-oxoacyl-ACP reductase-like protein
MIDRLTLSRAIEDAGIERTKAERLASTIVDLIHDEVANKADVAAVNAELNVRLCHQEVVSLLPAS